MVRFRLFGKKKEAPKAVAPCTCSLCMFMDLLEPKLKGKPYSESLLKFIIAPTNITDESPKEIEKRIKDAVKKGKIEEARISYLTLIGNVLAKRNVSVKDIGKYLGEFKLFLKRHKFSPSKYYPSAEDCSIVMNHADEIVGVVRKAYQK
jgi:hypothetical protein